MRGRIVGVGLVPLVLVLIVTACGGAASTQPSSVSSGPLSPDAARGKAKFDSTCAACHGNNAKGMPGLGKDLTTSTFAKGLSDADLIAFIKKGRLVSDPANTTKVEMPPKGGNAAFTDQDLADIVAYIRTLQK